MSRWSAACNHFWRPRAGPDAEQGCPMTTYDRTQRRRRMAGAVSARTALLASISLLAATAAIAAVPSQAGPVGAGPAPIDFNLTDEQGSWFDTGQDLSAA